MKKNIVVLFISVIIAQSSFAQDDEVTVSDRVITTALTTLTIPGDPRAGALGDMGAATSPDAFSLQYNAAKLAFSEIGQGFGVTYVPYLREIVNDINILQLTYFNRLNERSAVSGGLRYFSFGEINQTGEGGNDLGTVKPNEFVLSGAYALKLSERFSMSVTGKYFRSDLAVDIPGGQQTTPVNSFGVDLAGYYQSEEIVFNNFDGRIRGGFQIANIGPKISYDEGGEENFIPTNFKLGGGFDFVLDVSNKITAYGEINKLLVPTPQDFNDNGVLDSADAQEYQDINEFSAIISSWGDAPDGFSEELKEITWALGAEYIYEDSFMLRAGYFNESEEKGFRKYVTMGAGFKYNVLQVDLSYLFNTAAAVQSPLEGSLRFGLTLNFGETYDEY